MKKIIYILAILYLTIVKVNAVELQGTFNSLTEPDCYTWENYIGCAHVTNNGNRTFSLFSATWWLLSSWIPIGYVQNYNLSLTSVISGQTIDIINYWYYNGNFYVGEVSCIINKTVLSMLCQQMAWYSSYESYLWVEYINWYYYALYRGNISIRLDNWDMGTQTPLNVNLIKEKKIYYAWNHLLYKDANTLKLYYSRVINDIQANYQYTDYIIGNYIYKDWIFSAWLSHYWDTVRTTSILTWSISNYELTLSEVGTLSGIINSSDIVDNHDVFSIIKNNEIYDFKNNLDTPLFTKVGNELYYIDKTNYRLNLVSSDTTSYTLNNWSTWTWSTWTWTWSISNNLWCTLDVNNDGNTWILDGEFLTWIYNCIATWFTNITNWINWIMRLTNELNNIWTPWTPKTFTSFLFESANAYDTSMAEAFWNNGNKDNLFSKILNFMKFWMYFVIIIGCLFFVVSLKSNKK